jgi:imidazolonepropionase-like amidohydrolase
MIRSNSKKGIVLLLLTLPLCVCAFARDYETNRLAVRQVPFTPDSGTIALLCGKLIDGDTDTMKQNVLVLIRDGKIRSIKEKASRNDAKRTFVPVLDLTAYTCLPGLIDMHTHLTDRPEDTKDLTVYFTRPDEETLQLSKENASATLLAGFTTVRNVGTYALGSDTALRDTIDAGNAAGPRMQVSGPYLTIPHGGGDLYVPDYKEPAGSEKFHAGVARGADAFRERADFLIGEGSDLLKVIASGAVLAYGGVPGAPEMTQDEIQAVVDIAHAVSKRVAAHAHGAESIRMAIAAGVDTIEHASYLDDAGIAAALKQGHVALAMDVYNGDYIDTEGRAAGWPEEFLRKNVETTEIQRQAFTKAVKAGVPIVFATDAGVFPHGLNARQFPIMVQRGMTPMQAIQSATLVAAAYMGWASRIGSIEPDKLGDIIAVKGDPLQDISALQNVVAVVKGGILFKKPELPVK